MDQNLSLNYPKKVPTSEQAPLPHLKSQPKSNRILIIDDAIEMHTLLKTLLQEEGYIVDCVSNGQAALRYLRSIPELPALILLDLMMPVMDGYQFREEQLRDPRLANTPVILMTADGHIETKKNKIQAVDGIKKPIDIKTLLDVTARYFNHE